MDAKKLEFDPESFDSAFLCWILEHVPSPPRVLGEVRRVLAPGSPVVCSEVLNATFFIDPYSPDTLRYWMASTTTSSSSGAIRSSARSSATCSSRWASATSRRR